MHKRLLIRRTLISISILVLISINVFGKAQTTSDAILGEWLSPDKDGKFLFYQENGKFYGKIIWLKEPNDANGKPKLDKKNPDPQKRLLPMIGLVIFKDFKWDSKEQKWVDGKVYDARSGDTWSCELSLYSKLILEARGYLGFSWLGKSAYFTKY